MPMTSGSEDALAALAAYRAASGSRGALQATITDLLTDLLHLAASEGLDALALADQARQHFIAEAILKKLAA